jgi:GntR family transcriptional regulator
MTLNLHILTGSTVPIYRQIMDQVCQAVACGSLVPGEQLPSVRALAEQLVLNPNTVARTYGELTRDGVLETQKGRGVFVAQRRPVYTQAERTRRLEGPLNSFINDAVVLGFTPDQIRQIVERKLRVIEPAREAAGGDRHV